MPERAGESHFLQTLLGMGIVVSILRFLQNQALVCFLLVLPDKNHNILLASGPSAPNCSWSRASTRFLRQFVPR